MHSWSKFGLEGYVVPLYLKSIGWNVALSPASKGPADIVANCNNSKWFIQVEASSRIPRLKGYEVERLIKLAKSSVGLPVVSTFHPFPIGFSIGSFSILFYLVLSWHELDPMKFLGPGRESCDPQLARPAKRLELAIVIGTHVENHLDNRTFAKATFRLLVVALLAHLVIVRLRSK